MENPHTQVIPESRHDGKYRIAGNFRMVQNFAVFMSGSTSVKITTAKIRTYNLAQECIGLSEEQQANMRYLSWNVAYNSVPLHHSDSERIRRIKGLSLTT